MNSCIVSHPHAAAVSSATAAAFAAAGRLSLYVTGVCAATGTAKAQAISLVAKRWPQLANRLVDGVTPQRLKALSSAELTGRLFAWGCRRVPVSSVREQEYDALFLLHDVATSLMPWPRHADSIYAYEDAAQYSFRRAAREGVRCIWDLPTPHWPSVEGMWREEAARWPGAMGARPRVEPEWKKGRKDAELASADVISVASGFTLRSLEAAGCRKPVVVTPYGFPIDRFRAKPRQPSGPFTVIAVGAQDLRKGTPYLLEAWKRAGIAEGRLRLIGPMKLTRAFLGTYAGLFEHVPHVAKSNLEQEYHAADLLAFPTRGDGFGLVMQEAMCCGTPVLTTPYGGGPECIASGQDGWVVPSGAVDELVAVLRSAARERDRVHRMGLAARRRAEGWTWADAGRALITAIENAGSHRSSGARR